MKNIISQETSYTFSDYFKIINYVEDILSYFGYGFEKQEFSLPRSDQALERLADLKARLKESLPYVSMTSESARREFLIAPILLEVIHYTHTKIKVEFPLNLNEQLKGTLDYYCQSKNNLLIIEAKNGDLEKGFVQLAVELVALDQWLENDINPLYGAISTGNIWQFGILDRVKKCVTQDLNLFRVTADLEDLLKVLIGILNGK